MTAFAITLLGKNIVFWGAGRTSFALRHVSVVITRIWICNRRCRSCSLLFVDVTIAWIVVWMRRFISSNTFQINFGLNVSLNLFGSFHVGFHVWISSLCKWSVLEMGLPILNCDVTRFFVYPLVEAFSAGGHAITIVVEFVVKKFGDTSPMPLPEGLYLADEI